MTETFAMLGAVLIASVLGSLHCAGMCGGLVLFAVSADGTLRKRASLHAAYHGGRGIAYTALGLIAGGIGAAADVGAALAGNQRVSALLAGGAMVALGLLALASHAGLRRGTRSSRPGWLHRATEAAHRRAFQLPPLHRASVIGLLTPLLPCGWLYAFVIVAAGTGSPAWGAMVMASFWLGTLPVMGALGACLQQLTGPLRRRLPIATGVIVVGMGVMTAMGRVGLPSVVVEDVGDATLSEQIEAARRANAAGELPCCNGGPGDAEPAP